MEHIVSLIKYFFIAFSSIYIYTHMLNIECTQRQRVFHVGLSVVVAPLLVLIKSFVAAFTTFGVALFIFICTSILYNKGLLVNIGLSIISVGFSYATVAFGMLIGLPASGLIYSLINNTEYAMFSSGILSVFNNLLSFILIGAIFKIKRFKHGIPNIENIASKDICQLLWYV